MTIAFAAGAFVGVLCTLLGLQAGYRLATGHTPLQALPDAVAAVRAAAQSALPAKDGVSPASEQEQWAEEEGQRIARESREMAARELKALGYDPEAS